MKRYLLIFILITLSSTIFAQQPTFDLQFLVVNNDGTNYDVKVQMKGTPAFNLGTSNIKFNFNNADLGSPQFLSANPEFHNKSVNVGVVITIYGPLTVTEPVAGIASINVDLQAINAGSEISTNWTDIATVRFPVINPDGQSQLSFRTTSGGGEANNPSVVYDDDQATVAIPGVLSSENTTPLPVELSSFKVNAVEGTKAQLQWETATEVNNYGFEIEKSVVVDNAVKDASAPLSISMTWEKVAFVEGHGNSNSPKLYSFTDKNLIGGSKFVYRLKQIDIDGTFEYSDEVEIEVLPTKYELMQNYPNPFNPATKIRFSLPEDAKIAINIYNILGEKVASVLNEELKAGFHEVDFTSNSTGYQLSSGVYIYSIEAKNFTQVKKMILMK